MKKQYQAYYTLLDGSPRNLYPIYAINEESALEQVLTFVRKVVSKNYTPRDIKIIQT